MTTGLRDRRRTGRIWRPDARVRASARLARAIVPVPVLTLASRASGSASSPGLRPRGRKLGRQPAQRERRPRTTPRCGLPDRPAAREAIPRALVNEDREFAETRWPTRSRRGSRPAVRRRPHSAPASSTRARRPCRPRRAGLRVRSGGSADETGWYFGKGLWRCAGLLDLLVGARVSTRPPRSREASWVARHSGASRRTNRIAACACGRDEVPGAGPGSSSRSTPTGGLRPSARRRSSIPARRARRMVLAMAAAWLVVPRHAPRAYAARRDLRFRVNRRSPGRTRPQDTLSTRTWRNSDGPFRASVDAWTKRERVLERLDRIEWLERARSPGRRVAGGAARARWRGSGLGRAAEGDARAGVPPSLTARRRSRRSARRDR